METSIENSSKPELRPISPASEIYTVISPRQTIKKTKPLADDNEPLIDLTARLELHSKKTQRMQRKLKTKTARATLHIHPSSPHSFLDLPPELVLEILSHLHPSSILRLLLLNHSTHSFIRLHESTLTLLLLSSHYPLLSRTFPLPHPLSTLPPLSTLALLSPAWQSRLTIHAAPYQHIPRIDASLLCTCTSCLLAWNNLCLALDLAHFQPCLRDREPIPMIARGTRPAWNDELLATHARVVEAAVTGARPLFYAAILERHLATIVGTVMRPVRVGKKVVGTRRKRAYGVTEEDVRAGTDGFLEREGEPSYEFPFHRDRYYHVEAYVPNRKWDRERRRWLYATPGAQHEADVAWVVGRFLPEREG